MSGGAFVVRASNLNLGDFARAPVYRLLRRTTQPRTFLFPAQPVHTVQRRGIFKDMMLRLLQHHLNMTTVAKQYCDFFYDYGTEEYAIRCEPTTAAPPVAGWEEWPVGTYRPPATDPYNTTREWYRDYQNYDYQNYLTAASATAAASATPGALRATRAASVIGASASLPPAVRVGLILGGIALTGAVVVGGVYCIPLAVAKFKAAGAVGSATAVGVAHIV